MDWLRGIADQSSLLRVLVIITVVSWIMNVPVKIWHNNQMMQGETYASRAQFVLNRYAHIPSGSVIGMAHYFVSYLRPDIFTAYPTASNMLLDKDKFSKSEGIDHYLQYTCEKEPERFYLDVGPEGAGRLRSLNIAALVAQFSEDKIVEFDCHTLEYK